MTPHNQNPESGLSGQGLIDSPIVERYCDPTMNHTNFPTSPDRYFDVSVVWAWFKPIPVALGLALFACSGSSDSATPTVPPDPLETGDTGHPLSTGDTGAPPVVDPFLGCALESLPVVSSPVGPTVSSIDLAEGRWVGDTSLMAFGAQISSPTPDRVFVLSLGTQLPSDSAWSPRVNEFSSSPAGETATNAATGLITWPTDEDVDPMALVAWGTGQDRWIATSEFWYGATVHLTPAPLPAAGTDRLDSATRTLTDPDFGLISTVTNSMSVGDIDGDGILDLAIGQTRNAAYPSRVLIHSGPFVAGTADVVDGSTHQFDMWGYESDLSLDSTVGLSTPFVPDLDGDGAQEIMLASKDYLPTRYQGMDLNDFVSQKPGGMVLWVGVTPGSYTAGSETAIIEGTCESILFGRHGDVGAVGPDRSRPLVAAVAAGLSSHGLAERGAVFLMDLQGAIGTMNITDVSVGVILGDNAYDNMDDFAPLGDLDGDGHDDFVVTSRWANGIGAAYIFLGPVEGVRTASTADLIITGAPNDGVFGASVGVWDPDGDGTSDLLVGAYLADYGGHTNAGAVHSFPAGSLLSAMVP